MKGKIKKIIFAMIALESSQFAFAQEPAPSPQIPDAQQFQSWLNNNGHSPSPPPTNTVVVQTPPTMPPPGVPSPVPTSSVTAAIPATPAVPLATTAVTPTASTLLPPSTAVTPTVTTTIPLPAETTVVAPPPSPPPSQPVIVNNTVINRSPPPLRERPTPPPVVVRKKPVDVAHCIVLRGEPCIISKPMSYNKSQEIMLKRTPSPPVSAESKEAFNMMMQQNMPLTPQQVIRLRQLIDSSQRAASTPPNVPPKPVSSTLLVNLAPGSTPPAIRLSQGYVSSLVFVDSSGAPWPVSSFDIGDPKAVNIQWDGRSNILVVQAASPYSDGDIVVRLDGLATPITLELISGQRVVDFRVDIHVPGLGPNSKDVPIGMTLPNSANQLLLNVLEGVAPPGSKQLNVLCADSQAWLVGDKMFLRTRFTLLSPGWVGKMVSPDGMNAYELQKSSTILISRYGEPMEIKIEGF